MEVSNWRPNHDAAGDWRGQLQPEDRTRIVNRIMETLKKHMPVSVPAVVSELQNITMLFEEKIYTAATSQSDYLRMIFLKILSMETKTQQTPANASVLTNQNSMDSGVGMQPQGSNQAQSLAIPLMNQPQARHLQNSTSTAMFDKAHATSKISTIPGEPTQEVRMLLTMFWRMATKMQLTKWSQSRRNRKAL